jgi:hypothetical protein
MPARDIELAIAVGFRRQTGTGAVATTAAQLQAPLASGASMWRPNIGEFNIPFPTLNLEDDSLFFGKGKEWITKLFETSLDVQWNWSSFLTSQNFAQAIVFGLGKWTPSTPGVGASQYVATPMVPADDGVNLPATSMLAGIRQGTAGEILDIVVPGMCLNSFTLKISRGPGLQNTNLTQNWVGCGKYADGAGYVYPVATVEQRLGAGLMESLTILGIDYLANARFVELNFEYNNNISQESAYFPGSGSQAGYDIRGRMRYGIRTINFNYQVELENDSNELSNLLAGVEGQSLLKLEGPEIVSGVNHTAQLSMPRCRHKGFTMASSDNFVTAQVQTAVMDDESSGPLIATAITSLANIGAVP